MIKRKRAVSNSAKLKRQKRQKSKLRNGRIWTGERERKEEVLNHETRNVALPREKTRKKKSMEWDR